MKIKTVTISGSSSKGGLLESNKAKDQKQREEPESGAAIKGRSATMISLDYGDTSMHKKYDRAKSAKPYKAQSTVDLEYVDEAESAMIQGLKEDDKRKALVVGEITLNSSTVIQNTQTRPTLNQSIGATTQQTKQSPRESIDQQSRIIL